MKFAFVLLMTSAFLVVPGAAQSLLPSDGKVFAFIDDDFFIEVNTGIVIEEGKLYTLTVDTGNPLGDEHGQGDSSLQAWVVPAGGGGREFIGQNYRTQFSWSVAPDGGWVENALSFSGDGLTQTGGRGPVAGGTLVILSSNFDAACCGAGEPGRVYFDKFRVEVDGAEVFRESFEETDLAEGEEGNVADAGWGGTGGLLRPVVVNITDTDGDGMSDAYEIANGLNPSVKDADGDLDSEGLTNLQEYQRGTAANRADTDEDGLNDNVETNAGTYVSPSDTGTNPLKADTDGDGLLDSVETRTGTYASSSDTGSDPFVVDTDSDGFGDSVEVAAGYNPNLAASTPAGTSRIRLAIEFQFFPEPGASYRIEGSPDLATWSVIEPIVIGNGTRISRFYSTENQANRYFRAIRN